MNDFAWRNLDNDFTWRNIDFIRRNNECTWRTDDFIRRNNEFTRRNSAFIRERMISQGETVISYGETMISHEETCFHGVTHLLAGNHHLEDLQNLQGHPKMPPCSVLLSLSLTTDHLTCTIKYLLAHTPLSSAAVSR